MAVRPWLLLLCFSAVFQERRCQPHSYLVTAPTFLRLDAVETVLVQLFGYTGQTAEALVMLKSTMGPASVKYSEQVVTLNQTNNYQALAKVQVFPKDLVKGADHVILQVTGAGISDHQRVPISRSNGFMFIHTDKPLYTPDQSVKVRVYSLNEELRPANRLVTLTFKDPDGQAVDILELTDHNNGIPSMQNPFKIPINPKLGVWTIEATYSKDFDTNAVAVFQVKEYVLPSISISINPEKNYISSDNFQRFAYSISASYVHGVPVRGGVVFIRYGFISGGKEPVIIPNSLTRKILPSSGVVDVTENMKTILAGTSHSTLESLNGKYLYITVLIQEKRGGISEETEYTSVKFVRSPYTLQLISTPRFIKPGLPFSMKLLVRDPLGQPLADVPVNLVDQCIVRGTPQSCSCTGNQESSSEGFVGHICNIGRETTIAHFQFDTAAPGLLAGGQASLTLEAPAYFSHTQRYLYIEPPHVHGLQVGHWLNVKVLAVMPSGVEPSDVESQIVKYMVLSKGKVVAFGVGESADVSRRVQIVRLEVTPEMTPSIRLLVYYVIGREVVADSLWMDVKGKCVNSLKTQLSSRGQDHRPKSHLLLDVSANQDGLVAFSAVDAAMFHLRRNHEDPVNRVLRHIEHSDQGCGGGGGRDAQGVFQSAGLAVLTRSIDLVAQRAGACQEAVRPKRALAAEQETVPLVRRKRYLTEEQINEMVAGHGRAGPCCRKALGYIPSSVTCEQFAIQSIPKHHQHCRTVFQDCCERSIQLLPEEYQYDRTVPLVRRKRYLTEEQINEMVAHHGRAGQCCRRALGYIPSSVTCEQFAIQSIHKHHQRCRKAFQDCCERSIQLLPEEYQYDRAAMGTDFDLAPSLIRSYFPESWLWEVQPIRERRLSLNRTLPDSLTTWDISAVGMFQNGICVEDHLLVAVRLPVSVNIPLPYQLVRGEQLNLLGSVYNENDQPIEYCVTLTVGPEFCLLHSKSKGASGLLSTTCVWRILPASGLGKGGPFTLLGLQPGEHTLTFTLMTRNGATDIVKKKLRVVPEGVRNEILTGGRLDPNSHYGSVKTTVVLPNRPLPNLVPDSSVERVISINGELLGGMLSVILKPKGVEELIRRPIGSADAGLDGLLPLIHVYRYLEENQRWNILGDNIAENSFKLRKSIKEGVVSVLSFRVKEHPSSYSIWSKGSPSTRLTAKVVRTLALLKDVVRVDNVALGNSVDWLISNCQNQDGSFHELAADTKKVTADPGDQAVYLTSLVLMSLKRATELKVPALRLQSQQDSMALAVQYISEHAMLVKSVYVRAVATYALTYYDPDHEMATQLFLSLEKLAQQKGNPVELRYWKESNVADWQKPDKSSGLTVETTAYVLLTAVLKGRLPYAKPILTWLTQDQNYGGGFYSTEDTVLTLEAMNAFNQKSQRAELNQVINVHYRDASGKDVQTDVVLRENKPLAPPIEVQNFGDIRVSTGYGNGVSHIKLKTVYYETTVTSQNCNFDFNIEIAKRKPSSFDHSLTACVKYRPYDQQLESGLTVLHIHLPTGVEANLDDLKPFKEGDIPAIMHFRLEGNVVIIETDAVPSDIFRCVGFRVRSEFNVIAAAKSAFIVFEKYVKESVCKKLFSFSEEDLQRLCMSETCQCMTAACAIYRGNDTTFTKAERIHETCRDHIKYAYKVKIESGVAEGDFMTYTAKVVQVLKQADRAFESVRPGVEVDLLKKATCISAEVHNGGLYLVQGSRGSPVLSHGNTRYRFPLDSDAVLEWLPSCSAPGCVSSQIAQYEEDLQVFGCAFL